jgi:hypothetical protein
VEVGLERNQGRVRVAKKAGKVSSFNSGNEVKFEKKSGYVSRKEVTG